MARTWGLVFVVSRGIVRRIAYVLCVRQRIRCLTLSLLADAAGAWVWQRPAASGWRTGAHLGHGNSPADVLFLSGDEKSDNPAAAQSAWCRRVRSMGRLAVMAEPLAVNTCWIAGCNNKQIMLFYLHVKNTFLDLFLFLNVFINKN